MLRTALRYVTVHYVTLRYITFAMCQQLYDFNVYVYVTTFPYTVHYISTVLIAIRKTASFKR